MTIALDIGSYRVKSLRCGSQRLTARRCRSLYAVLPDSPSRRRILNQAGIPFAICDDSLTLIGDAAAEFSRLFRAPCVPLFPEGKVPHADPPARQMIGTLINAILPKAQHAGDICCMTVPGVPLQKIDDDTARFLMQLVQLRGYTPMLSSSAMAVVLAELVADSFTGIGVSFGAATSEVSLAHCGVEIARCIIDRGGNWIDEQLANESNGFAWDADGNRYLDTEIITHWKEAFTGTKFQPQDELEQRLLELHQELATYVLGSAFRKFAETPKVHEIPQPVQLVATGGTTRFPGFQQLLNESLAEIPLPVAIREARIVNETDYTVARGCLIRAQLESESTGCENAAA